MSEKVLWKYMLYCLNNENCCLNNTNKQYINYYLLFFETKYKFYSSII